MDQLELKYANLMGLRLRNFVQKSETLFNFACPLCGDSKTKKSRARGYIYEKNGILLMHCHNCQRTLSIGNFLKAIAPDLHDQFRLERLKQDKRYNMETVLEKKVFEKPKFLDYGALKGLKTVSQLSEEHPIKKFVKNRKIPNEYHWKLYAVSHFMNWVNVCAIPGKFDQKALKYDGPRLVIPFFDKNKKCFAFQGRAVKSDGAKYICISLDKSEHILYGRDTVDTNRTIYVMEGPLDSMFIPNSVAVGSSNLPVAASLLPKEKLVLVFDNEPRNKEVIKVMGSAVEQGFKIVIFPDTFVHKDINDAIIAGMQPSDIQKVMDDYTYQGLSALLALKNWERI